MKNIFIGVIIGAAIFLSIKNVLANNTKITPYQIYDKIEGPGTGSIAKFRDGDTVCYLFNGASISCVRTK